MNKTEFLDLLKQRAITDKKLLRATPLPSFEDMSIFDLTEFYWNTQLAMLEDGTEILGWIGFAEFPEDFTNDAVATEAVESYESYRERICGGNDYGKIEMNKFAEVELNKVRRKQRIKGLYFAFGWHRSNSLSWYVFDMDKRVPNE